MASSRRQLALIDNEIGAILARHAGEDGRTDSTAGTPAHAELIAYLKSNDVERNWSSEACQQFDRYIDARAPKAEPDQMRLPQMDAVLRLDRQKRITVVEREARRSHWAARINYLFTTRDLMVKAINKEIRYDTDMMALYISDVETTEQVLKRKKADAGLSLEAAD